MAVHYPVYTPTHQEWITDAVFKNQATSQRICPNQCRCVEQDNKLCISGDIRFGDNSELGSCCLVLGVSGCVRTHSTAFVAPRIASALFVNRGLYGSLHTSGSLLADPRACRGPSVFCLPSYHESTVMTDAQSFMWVLGMQTQVFALSCRALSFAKPCVSM